MPYILLVDDDEPLRSFLKGELEQQGYVVDDAPNGRVALLKVFENPPDLIICDIMMPEMDGFEFQEKLSESPELRNIPFIFLSVLADKENIRQAKIAGADDYVIKPFELEDLLIAIESKLKKAIDRQELLNYKLDEIRKSILYALPHEFRNPLSTLNGFISLLLDKDFEKTKEEEEEFLNYVRSSGERLNHLVTNFMKLAELEIIATNREQVKKLRQNRNFKWALELSNFINDFTISQNIKVNSVIEGADFPVSLDLEAIQNILHELLSNVKKFTKTEPIIAELKASAKSKEFILIVKDYGIGIEEEALKHLTETFYQHNRKFNEQQGGGLGLAIVNKIVSIYGGNLNIISKPNEGTEVYINIPLLEIK